ncbi:MAG TPA: epimerase [Chlorobaculum sp.]|uniref:Dihydroflavonol 4-reductase family n=1 Tax=Chlorobaculum tepidum (strain ATCC 49652 / DSM 12025 / NBRC 103806 / TLS) TaxID=194439 RepID=Q8KB60_CHLTE|nr:SDR family oxidoreductase [Chlorobaculum tepidum]AAM73150.1 dihydroflavonol 4-reductase family [Chlorobaculum tepidum TLS]HBU23290.1 epimerase [Chlorobaculum sp.]
MSGIPILITGATGYIGARLLVDMIARYGDSVRCRVTVREGSDASFLRNLPVEIAQADMHDPIAVNEAVKGAEVVFHCAGLIAYTRNFRNRLYDTNVLGTRHIVDACLEAGVKRLVATSSIAAVGSSDAKSGIRESNEQTPFTEWQRHNVYMESKYLAELECRRGVAEGLDVVMVNPGVVIGKNSEPGMSGSSSNEVLRMIYEGRLPLCPDGATGFVDVRDVADAHIAAWQKGKAGERYIIVGENLSFRELFERIAALPGSRSGKVFRVNRVARMLAGVGGELFSLLTKRPSFISIESLRQAAHLSRYSNQRSVRELGMSYRPFEETLRSAIMQ